MTWSQENKALVAAMWTAGKTTREIMTTLGALGYPLTRNAVIGCAHRMGLAYHRSKPPREYVNVVPDRFLKKRKRRVFHDPEIPPGDHVHISELTDDSCRYISGNPSKLMYCGAQVMIGEEGDKGSYCATHHALCVQPPRVKENSRSF